MPGWNIHLEVGEKINKKLKFTSKDREEFFLGCILPDINNGYINRVKNRKEHRETHYAFDEKSSRNFYTEYKWHISHKTPMYIGYLLHLYTDGYFNADFYKKVMKSKYANLDSDKRLDIKHNDFWIFDTKFAKRILKVTDKFDACAVANKIDAVDITPSEIEEVEEILKDIKFNTEKSGGKYIFYTEEELDNLLNKTVDTFFEKYISGGDLK